MRRRSSRRQDPAAPPNGKGRLQSILRQIEQVAEVVNPVLVILAVGLATLDFALLLSLELPRVPL